MAIFTLPRPLREEFCLDRPLNVRLGSLAGHLSTISDVRFTLKSGHAQPKHDIR
jgi:hypothetical protein